MPDRNGPLVGLRVVELAGLGPAEHGCMMLADMGAEVIRVERLTAVPDTAGREPPRTLLSRGRRSIALDLRHAEGLAAVRRLIETADVLVDPYRPGVLERLGLDPDDLLAVTTRLVIARMTGWGQDGPLAKAAGHDLNYIAVSGALHEIGEPDRLPAVPLNLVADYGGGGMLLVAGILAALLERERSGNGQTIDVAMVDGVASQLAGVLHLHAIGGYDGRRGSSWVQGGAPWYRPYAASDGAFVTVAALESQFYALLLHELGLDPDDYPQWDRECWPELQDELTRIFGAEPGAHWRQRLEGTDACFAVAVPLVEAAQHPHLIARETYVERDGVVQPAPAPRFSRTPAALNTPPPWPGQDTEAVLEEIGIDVAALIRDGAARVPRAL
jgi:alpha-methylacyl-CoA racemase